MLSTGKQFETLFKEQVSELPDVYVHRIHDQMNGLKGSCNIADFLVYRRPHLYACELKTTQGASLPIANIPETQLNGMYEAIQTRGVKAYFIVWFIDKDITKIFPAKYVWRAVNKQGKKSIRYDDENGVLIEGEKLKKYFKYDWSPLFK